MHRTIRPLATLTAGFMLLLAAVGPAWAAEPPSDIAFDGVVNVLFHDPEYDDGKGIEGAYVSMLAVDLGADMVLEEYDGTTDASGVATFTGVVHAIDPDLEFSLQANASRSRSFVDADGCTVTEVLAGSASAPAGLEVTRDIEIQTQETRRICPGATPPPLVVVEGNALHPNGEALPILHADAELQSADGVTVLPVETGDNGAFRIEVPGPDDVTVERYLNVSILGPETRTVEDEEGCLITWNLVARGSWTLAGTTGPEPRSLVAAEEPWSGVCGEATATPAVLEPGLTLPPTDTSGNGLVGSLGGFAAGLLLLSAITLAATIAARRRVSRRGS